ncbi:MAG: hypothetical protein J6Q99_03050, partial [Oscillospiraceae bacterium]|nr:hypothetical protein [Oscillospiraceae bacterium]
MAEKEKIKLSGTVETIVFRNDDTGFTVLDAIVGICVSVLIFVAGIKILNETKNSLLGEAPSEEIHE